MAEELAYLIESRIMENRWPVGRLLGTEPELMAFYGVSRSALTP